MTPDQGGMAPGMDMRNLLAQIMQAQQGQVPADAGMNLDQSPGSGHRPYPDMSPASDPMMQQTPPGQRPYPDMTPDVPPQGVPQMPQNVPPMPPQGAGQPPFPATPDPRYTPEVEQRFQQFIGRGAQMQPPMGDQAFKLPMQQARAKDYRGLDVDGLDILGARGLDGV
jgi:hypothetical protein